MNPDDYAFLAELLQKESGLSLGPGKEYLVTSRLEPVAASLGLTDLEGLIRRLRFQPDPETVEIVCDAMTTNESLFFRDVKPFEALREVVFPALMTLREKTRRIRIWCTACSTAQEPYSIAMLIVSSVPALKDWQVEILATDISAQALERARSGVYTQFEVQRGLPIQMLVRFFKQNGREFQIAQEIRDMVTFRSFNLLRPFTGLGVFDIIFCRNVLIYFDHPTKSDVLHRLTDVLAPEGYLFLGSAETILGLSEEFERAGGRTGCYQKRGPSAGAAKAAAKVPLPAGGSA
ncbi:MAG: CheR family methyltransferase [Nitrospinota bacterium]